MRGTATKMYDNAFVPQPDNAQGGRMPRSSMVKRWPGAEFIVYVGHAGSPGGYVPASYVPQNAAVMNATHVAANPSTKWTSGQSVPTADGQGAFWNGERWEPAPLKYDALVLRDGAVAYWRLDETSGTTAASKVGNYPGTISGGVTLGQAGALSDGNKAMAFDGVNGKIETTAVMVPASCTVEAWIRRTELGDYLAIVSNRAAASSGNFFLYTTAGLFQIYTDAGPLSSGVNVATGQWHHVVWTTDSATQTQNAYVDGQPRESGPYIKLPLSNPIRIANDLYAGFGPGSIDDVAIYPTALTPQQIADHYAAR